MYDIALNEHGDWVFAANADYQGVSSNQVVNQRILTRLRIIRGWELDPTNGSLGSRLRSDLRLPHGRAVRELPLSVREALAPMLDIQVQDVIVTDNPDDINSLIVQVNYSIVDPTGLIAVERLANSLVLQLGT